MAESSISHDSANSKHCPKCGETKPLNDFGVRPNGRPTGYCRPCNREYQNAWHHKNNGVHEKPCSRCGSVFTLAYNHQAFCSDECRFWAKVAKAGADDCWLWTGTKPAFGHGQFVVNSRVVYAHRFSWELVNGKLPPGDDVCVLHKCDVPACVNPSHLFVGTREENLADMRAKGRGQNPPPRRRK